MKKVLSLMLVLAMALTMMPASFAAEGASEDTAGSWTYAVYMCGTDLESSAGAATSDLLEMIAGLKARKAAGIKGDFRVLVLTNGTETWNTPEPDENGKVMYGDLDLTDVAKLYKKPADGRTQIWEVTAEGMKLLVADWHTDAADGNPKNSVMEAAMPAKLTGNPVSMGEAETVTQFFHYVKETAPADHMMFSFWDHGGGPTVGAELDEVYSKEELVILDVAEIKKALTAMKNDLGKKLDLIGFDCCLMSSMEIAYMLKDTADYLIASEEVEPGWGWYYRWIETAGTDYNGDGSINAIDLGTANVDNYGLSTAGTVYLNKSGKTVAMPENMTMGTVPLSQVNWPATWSTAADCTLCLIDLSKMDNVMAKFREVATSLYGLIRNGDNASVATVSHKAYRTTHMMSSDELIDISEFVDRASDGLGECALTNKLKAWQSSIGTVKVIDATVTDSEGKVHTEKVKSAACVPEGDDPAILYRGSGARFYNCMGMSFYYPSLVEVNDNRKYERVGNGKDTGMYKLWNMSPEYDKYVWSILNGADKDSWKMKGDIKMDTVVTETGDEITALMLTEKDDADLVWNVMYHVGYIDVTDENSTYWYLGSTAADVNYNNDPLALESFDGSWLKIGKAGASDDELQFATIEYSVDDSFFGTSVVFVDMPAYVKGFDINHDGKADGADETIPVIISMIGFLEDGSDEFSIFMTGFYNQADSDAVERAQLFEEGMDVTFTPLIKSMDINDDGIGLHDTGKYTPGKPITIKNEENTSMLPFKVTIKKVRLDNDPYKYYGGYFEVNDLSGTPHWTDMTAAILMPDYFAKSDVPAGKDPLTNSMEAMLDPIPVQIYNGQAKTPKISFKGVYDQMITEGVDYKVTYTNNTNIGTAAATVTALPESTIYGNVNNDPNWKPSTFSVNFSISEFEDVPQGKWFYDAVKYVYDKNMMKGVSETKFAPDGETDRAMVATVLWRLAGSPIVTESAVTAGEATTSAAVTGTSDGAITAGAVTTGAITEAAVTTEAAVSENSSVFTDIAKGQWYYDAVRWAADKGIVTGYGNGKFGPTDKITREQLAAMIYRYEQKVNGGGFSGDWVFNLDFDDAGKISTWADEPMRWMVANGVMKGKSDKVLDPTGKSTRAELAQMLMNYLERGKDASEKLVPGPEVSPTY